jgi:uncharacterized protein YjiS (DUF1127 family)
MSDELPNDVGPAKRTEIRASPLAAGWQALTAWLAARFQAPSRATLKSLSNRQLADAGIDLTVAGRGKAVAAEPDPNLEGLR